MTNGEKETEREQEETEQQEGEQRERMRVGRGRSRWRGAGKRGTAAGLKNAATGSAQSRQCPLGAPTPTGGQALHRLIINTQRCEIYSRAPCAQNQPVDRIQEVYLQRL